MKLLMHMCCAPCSTYPVKILKEKNIDFTGYFYNPNIHPYEEYERRRNTVKEFSEIVNIDVIYNDEYLEREWLEYKDNNRCKMCYNLRIEKTALYASLNGYNAFTSTLLISPYQNHELIKELGNKYAKKYGIEFYYEDFRPYFREGQSIAREYNLYRQKYCGCIISFNSK